MQMAQLSRASGIAIPTVKYYLREGLLPAGRPTGATRAEYEDHHLLRLRLIRALVEVAGLSLAAVRQVLAAADHPAESVESAIEAAQEVLPPQVPEDVDTEDALAIVTELGWQVDTTSLPVRQLAVALETLDSVGADTSLQTLSRYARAVLPLAEHEVDAIPAGSIEAAVQYTVVGTVFYEPVLLALRRLAQQDASVRRFGASNFGQQHTL